jgi:hypothetical protein
VYSPEKGLIFMIGGAPPEHALFMAKKAFNAMN